MHSFSPYSSGNAGKIFWIATAILMDLYFFMIFLFHYGIKKLYISLSNQIYGLIIISILVLCFFVIEFAIRLYINNSSWYLQFRPHPVLYWYNRSKLQDHVDFSNYVPKSTNSKGFRYKEDIPIKKQSNEYRIFVFGDSSTFGHGVSDNETFSVQLEDMLNNKYGKYKFRVVNTACPGHTTFQGIIILKQMVLPLKPDMIIVAYNNDPGLEFAEEKARAFRNVFIEKLNILLYHSDYYLLTQRVANDLKIFLLSRFNRLSNPSLVRRVSIEDYKKNIKEFLRIADKYSFHVLFLKMPVNLRTFEVAPELKELFYDEQYPIILTQTNLGSNHLLIDIDSKWPERWKESLFQITRYKGTEIREHFHPNAIGHRKIAEQIFDVIIQNELIR